MNYTMESTYSRFEGWFRQASVPNLTRHWHSTPEYVLLSSIIAVAFVATISLVFKRRSTVDFPRFYLSNSNWVDRLLEPFRLLSRTKEAALKGYKAFPDCFFRLSPFHYPSGLIVVDRKHLKEYFSAPNEHLSFIEGTLATSDFRYVFKANVHEDYHVGVVRNQLTQNLSNLTPHIADELNAALADELDPRLKDDWTPVMVYKLALTLVSRTTYRVFTGLPLCRNTEFLKAAIRHATEADRVPRALAYYPRILRPVIFKFYRDFHQAEKVTRKYLTPIVEEHRKAREISETKSVDLIQWLMDVAPGIEKNTDQLESRILALNFAAIHTSSMAFTHVLYDLTTYPDYIEPLREEIDQLVATYGWHKTTFMKMKKLDSFIKESLRLNMTGGVGSLRKVMKPFTFSNGITIPEGQYLASPSSAIHADDTVYENALQFDGFRFSRMRERDGENAKHHSVNTGTEYLVFGHGKHACPGRFFAVNEVKTMIAIILMRYDIMAECSERPENTRHGAAVLPNKSANILFRQRK